jgi:hypothetical protein
MRRSTFVNSEVHLPSQPKIQNATSSCVGGGTCPSSSRVWFETYPSPTPPAAESQHGSQDSGSISSRDTTTILWWNGPRNRVAQTSWLTTAKVEGRESSRHGPILHPSKFLIGEGISSTVRRKNRHEKWSLVFVWIGLPTSNRLPGYEYPFASGSSPSCRTREHVMFASYFPRLTFFSWVEL